MVLIVSIKGVGWKVARSINIISLAALNSAQLTDPGSDLAAG
jgi:hypothetical protein